MPNTSRPLIVVFDGQCLFCNAWVRFLLRYDWRGVFCFAAIQGRTGQALQQQAGLARWVPAGLCDALYRWLARNRYRLFGRAEHCMVPPPELRARFLD